MTLTFTPALAYPGSMAKRVPYTSKTLELLRDQGWMCEKVEQWIPGANIRRDLFGIIDIIAIDRGQVLGIQSTSWDARKPHLEKIYRERLEQTKAWLDSGAHLWLITWQKVKIKRGGKAFRYEPHVDIIDLKKNISVV